MAVKIDDIDPGTLYSLSEAAALIPSPRQGKTTSRRTIYHWIKEGRLKTVDRQAGKLHQRFIWGAELLNFMNVEAPPPLPKRRTPAQRQRDIAAAEEFFRKRGML